MSGVNTPNYAESDDVITVGLNIDALKKSILDDNIDDPDQYESLMADIANKEYEYYRLASNILNEYNFKTLKLHIKKGNYDGFFVNIHHSQTNTFDITENKFKDIDSLITAKTDYIHDLTLLKECLITLVKDAHLVVVKPGYINTYSSTALSITEISNTIENIIINMQELCILYYGGVII